MPLNRAVFPLEVELGKDPPAPTRPHMQISLLILDMRIEIP